jgi:hypothetical protein
MNFIDRLLPAPKNGGFNMPEYWIWCGSVVKGEDNRFHMFASRWPKAFKMSPHWLFSCEIVRASSDTPEGPYQFEEVVLGSRDPKYFRRAQSAQPQHQEVGRYLLSLLLRCHLR